MPKRSSSDISSGSDTAMSSDAPDTKPQIHDDLLDIDTKLAKKQKQNQKKSTEKGKCARQEVRKWTPEEEKIFVEILEKVSGVGLWQEIKNDGRLEYRGGPGIRAHYLAFFKNIKKSAGSE